MRISPVLSAVALLWLASAPSAQVTPTLDGAWTAVSAQRDGKPAPDLVGHQLTLGSGKFSIERDSKRLYGGTYKANASAKPAQIDFHNTEGTLRGTWKGIYEIGGDTLRTCDNAPDMKKPRPAEFAAPAGSGYVAIEFRRAAH